MSDLAVIDPNLLAIIQSSFTTDGLPMPFVQEIFLIECKVAGTSYLNLTEIEPHLLIDEILLTLREPENKFDEFAILILTQKGKKLGYIPRDKNEILARLMDAGKLILAKIVDKKWVGNWLNITMSVFMRDY